MMRPLALTITGAAIGLAAVLPLVRTQIVAVAVAVAAAGAGVQVGPAPGQSGHAAGSTQTATGPTIGTRYGPVQAEVTVTGARFTSATAVRLPDGDGQSRAISAAAGPRLDAAAMAAQDAGIDTVSGASYTSDGYRRSLRAALDMARAATP